MALKVRVCRLDEVKPGVLRAFSVEGVTWPVIVTYLDGKRPHLAGHDVGEPAHAHAQRHYARPRWRGSRRSRSPSPRRFAPSTTHVTAMPGMIA